MSVDEHLNKLYMKLRHIKTFLNLCEYETFVICLFKHWKYQETKILCGIVLNCLFTKNF